MSFIQKIKNQAITEYNIYDKAFLLYKKDTEGVSFLSIAGWKSAVKIYFLPLGAAIKPFKYYVTGSIFWVSFIFTLII